MTCLRGLGFRNLFGQHYLQHQRVAITRLLAVHRGLPREHNHLIRYV